MVVLNRNSTVVFLVALFLCGAGVAEAQQKSVRGGVKKAEGFYALGDSLYSAGSYSAAAKYYDMAGGIYERKKKWLEAAVSYKINSECYFNEKKYNDALVSANKSISLIKANKQKITIKGVEELIKVQTLFGWIQIAKENYEEALIIFNEAISLIDNCTKCKNTYFIDYYRANLFYSIGQIFAKQGHYNRSLNALFKANTCFEKLSGEISDNVARTYSNIGGIYLYNRDYDKANIFLAKSQNIFKYLYGENSIQYADILINMALLYNNIGETREAKNYLIRAKTIYDISFQRNDVQYKLIFNNLAEIYLNKKMYDSAFVYYQKSKELIQNTDDSAQSFVAFIDNNIGLLHYEKKDYLGSIPHFINAIEARKKIFGTKHFRLAQSYYYLGCSYLEMSEFQKSLELFQKALIALCNDFSDTSITANPEIKSEYKTMDLFSILCEKFYALYKHSFTQQDCPIYLEKASETYELAYSLLDIIRTEYTYQDSKIIFTAKNKQKLLKAFFLFDELNDNSQNFDKDAYFDLGEKLKSFVLYSSLFDNEISYISGIPDSIAEIENRKKSEIKYLKTEIQKKKNLDNDNDADLISIAELHDMILKSSQSYDSLLFYLKNSYPEYFELKYQTKAPRVTEVMEQLSDSEVIIDYLINDTTLYFLVFTSDDYDVVKTTIGRDLEDEIVSYYRQIKKAGSDKQLIKSGQELYKKLISPIENIIRNKQRLIIIPDEYLGYLPFETLIRDETIKRNYSGFEIPDYLLNDHEVVYNYSVSLWWKARTKKESVLFAKEFVGFAPVFGNEINVDTIQLGISDSVKYSLVERSFLVDGTKIEKLPHSKVEVEEICQLFNNDSSDTRIFIGSDATKRSFLKNISDSRYIHIATHGFVNDKYPELSGLVFNPVYDSLANNIDEKKRSDFYDQNILFSGEMYNLKINADLLVLSACETGLGKLSKGEGMLAMTRGLIYSGAENILFSLWKVNDKYTKELMVSFYKHILSGQPYSNALRLAKIDMYDSDITSIPKFWSSFILLGE